MDRITDRLSSLAPSLRAAVTEAATQPDPGAWATTKLWDGVLGQLRWPELPGMIPLAEELEREQRLVAELLAERPGTFLPRWALPAPSWSKRRWLALDPPGALERVHLDGAPVWRALHGALGDNPKLGAILTRLPLPDRLAVLCEMGVGAYRFEGGLHFVPWGRLDEIGDHGRGWAPAFADHLVTLFADGVPESERAGQRDPDILVRQLVSLALVRSGIPIEPRWDSLILPTVECLGAIPEPRRSRAIVAGLGRLFPDEVVGTALALLPAFPSPDLAAALLRASADANRPQAQILAELAPIAARHSEIQGLLDQLRAQLAAAPDLRRGRVWSPRDAGALTTVEEQQIAHLGRQLDRRDRPAAARLAADGADAFHTLEATELVDGSGAPAFVVLVANGDTGAVFRAGTAVEVAAIVQHIVQCPDAGLRQAIKAALAAKRPAGRGGAKRPPSPSPRKPTAPSPKPPKTTRTRRRPS